MDPLPNPGIYFSLFIDFLTLCWREGEKKKFVKADEEIMMKDVYSGCFFLQDLLVPIARRILTNVAPILVKMAEFAPISLIALGVLVLLAMLENDAKNPSRIADTKILA